MSPESSLQSLDYSVLEQRMHCGMCLPSCPTFDATKRERNSPRGRVALMRAVADGKLGMTVEFAEEMSYCLGCLACQSACPAGVNYALLSQPDQAETLLRRKVGHIDATGAQLLATANPGCHLQIARGLQDAGVGTDVVHPISLLASAYRRDGLGKSDDLPGKLVH